ncbi:PREDICTED: thrombospondin type-1 domain-containing protein 7A [Propithecus coquereli]|uniref:thrombospondin type-1 domain-containing protein 7A n=1 Tax=Propithecus coquereli TaxID=379532 RepID=UPI00063F7157|nr:PREDICTED: thrombospondin type-1 domain-containing protein 7A [Propithecus coquereli]
MDLMVGPWGRCMGDECGLGGIQTRAVWCAHAEGWTTLHTNCKQAERPNNQQNCFKVCDWHKELYDWRLGPWNQCQPVISRSLEKPLECTKGEEGIQVREITCVQKDKDIPAEDIICEYFEPKPLLEQACLIPCQQDCIVSEFSAWSECSKTCGSGLQHRTRHVVAPPRFGGSGCPNLTEFQVCQSGPCEAEELMYSLHVGPWSTCSVPHSRQVRQARRRGKNKERDKERGKGVKDPEARELIKKKRNRNRQNRQENKYWDIQIGYQTREVTCTNKTGKAADLSFCQQEKLPMTFQSCVITKECQVSEWSEWSPCSKTCHDTASPTGTRVRTRTIRQFPIGGEKECPELEEKEPCLSQGDGVAPSSKPVDLKLCTGPLPNTTQLCHIPCPIECEVSPWSAWGPCTYENCNDQQGKKGFKLRKRRITNEPTGGSGGTGNCPHLLEAIPCEEPSCYDWKAVRLGDCEPDNGKECGPGTQVQEVVCINSDGEEVDRQLCRDAIFPIPVACDAPCPKDCVLSTWSTWSSCSHTCSGKTTEGKQIRARSILAYADEEGGVRCPNSSALQEVRSCNEHPCTVYHWQTGPWGQCIEDTSVSSFNTTTTWNGEASCSIGMQTRKVICVRVNVGQVGPKNYRWKTHKWRRCQLVPWSVQQDSPGAQEGCGPGRQARAITCRKQDGGQAGIHECLQYAGPVPALTQACQIPCQDDCQLTSWSKFSSCNGDCGAVRTRKRTIVGYIEEACIIPCPSDCKLSEWSNWSRCSKSCGSGVKVRSKWLREKPYNGGRPCPKLDHVNQVYEVVPCHSDCNQYIWVTEPWSVCKVTFVNMRDNCGEGVQTRKVRCMQNTADGPSEHVEDYLCDPEEMPLGSRECKLPCPEDCVISEWGPWTRCALPCNQSSFRQRSADPIRQPADEGRSCPDAVEKEPCNLNKNCYHYDYNVTDWSTCQLSEKAVCGNGIKTRMLDCVRSDGKSVDLKYCEELGLEKNWQMNTSCVVECPVNCQLSDWSLWSECSQTCGLTGKMIRRRTVTQPFQGDGRPCPSLMDQSKPCPVKPCYRWQYGQWSPCQVQEAQCGEGTRTRNISCVVSDGSADDFRKVVDEEFCADIEPIIDGNRNMVVEETCTQPCPGDCYLKDWSSWSLCQLTCVNGEDLGFGGIQVRSRAVIIQELENQHLCPEQMLETKSCDDGQCYEYKWMASAWKGSSRTVWCQRSDGVNVTGGCLVLSQPDTDRSCNPPCSQPHSYCSETKTCHCEEGYTEVMSSNSTLEQCTLIPVVVIPTVEDRRGDVKTSRAVHPTQPSSNPAGRGRTWFLQPFGPDGRLKTWVYGVAAGAFVLLIFIVSMIYLACKKPKKPQRRQNNRLKPLTLAYDGDADM